MEPPPPKRSKVWIAIVVIAILIAIAIAVIVYVFYFKKPKKEKEGEKEKEERLKEEAKRKAEEERLKEEERRKAEEKRKAEERRKEERDKERKRYDVDVPEPGIVYQLSNFTIETFTRVPGTNTVSIGVKSKNGEDVKKAFGLIPVRIGGVQYPWRIERYTTSSNMIVLPYGEMEALRNYIGRVLYPGDVRIPRRLPVPSEPIEITPFGGGRSLLNRSFDSSTQFFPIGRVLQASGNRSTFEVTITGIERHSSGKAIINASPLDKIIQSISFSSDEVYTMNILL